MKKTLLLTITVLVLLSVAVLPAAAGRTWCAGDPQIKLPNGKILEIWVAVPDANQGEEVSLDIWAPKGSQIVGETGDVKVKVNLKNSPDRNQIKAQVHEKFPVKLWAMYSGKNLGEFTFDKGKGMAVWHW